MGTGDGAVLGKTKIVDNGSPAERWNLVLVSEGYRDIEMAQFASDASQFVDALFSTPPFNHASGKCGPRLHKAINVYRVDVTSTDSGADDPLACGGTGATPATYFDASFCHSGVRRALEVNNWTVFNVVNAQVPQWHMIMVLVNSTIYGGSGGDVAVFSMAPEADEIGLHEMGHTAFGLADEYEYYAGCGVDVGHDVYPWSEPSEPNVTKNTNPSTIKWKDLILPSTPIPTTSNPDCTQCDTQPSPVPPGTVGLFEGAHYYHCGAFRPEYDCKMRALDHPFCAVCERRIIQTLEPFLPPPSILDVIRCLDLYFLDIESLIRNPFLEVGDPSPLDLVRLGRVLQRRREPGARVIGDDLTDLLARVDTLDAGELRVALLRVKTAIARLETAARVLQGQLDTRGR